LKKKEKACRNCGFLTTAETCLSCGGTTMSGDWAGYTIVIDPDNSEIAKRLNITKPGKYALKVR
jgi:DNA-directed RNA polymerase subunit E"